TTGVKKSIVCTSARSSRTRKTAASSPVGVPTSSRGSVAAGSVRTIGSRSAAASLAPHPAPEDSDVSGIAAGAGEAMGRAYPRAPVAPSRRAAGGRGLAPAVASQPGGRLGRAQGLARRGDRLLEHLGLALHELRGLHERRAGGLQRLGLALE